MEDRKVLRGLLKILQNELRRCNPYVQDLKHACEIVDKEDPTSLQLVLNESKRPRGEHARRFNQGFKEISGELKSYTSFI